MTFTPPPSLECTSAALKDLRAILKPPRKLAAAKGYKDPGLEIFVRERKGNWSAASLATARAHEKGPGESLWRMVLFPA